MTHRHVVLIGLMGVGKTTVGQVLADRLGRALVDSDPRIEALTGRTAKQILADDGVAQLRSHEAAALFDALACRQPLVIAAAGGVVLAGEHRRRLIEADAHVVWLDADPTLLTSRAAGRPHRPWLEHDPAGTLQRMRDEREALYSEVADQVVVVDGLTPAEVADRIAP